MKQAETSEIAAIFQDLEKEHGVLRPDDVIDRAKDPESPLHPHFTWDDSEAAHRWRQHQARHLIASIRVEITNDTRTIETFHYVESPTKRPGSQGYSSIVSIRSQSDEAHIVVLRELQRVEVLLHRVEEIAAVLGFREEIEDVSARVASIRRRVERDERDSPPAPTA